LSGDELNVLAKEQAALRRVATLVARGALPEKLFDAVVEEVGRVLPVDLVSMARYGPDHTITFLTSWGAPGHFVPIGQRLKLGGQNLNTIVFETGRSARIDSYDDASGAIGLAVREGGVRTAVGTPIVVEDRLWGMMAAGSSGAEPLPADTEARLASFTELLATAIANAESRAGLARLAAEQAALRRIATLVAQAVPADDLFRAATAEAGTLLGADVAAMGRHETDGTLTVVATWAAGGERPSSALRAAALGGLGIRSSVACPIVVEGRSWGELSVHSTQPEPLPADTEARLMQFTELVATAMANAEARSEAQRLADEQAALRRVATLVAQGVPPADIFAAVSDEVGGLFGEHAGVVRFESEGPAVVLVGVSTRVQGLAVGSRWDLDDSMATAQVYRTGRSGRVDATDWSSRSGPVAEAGQRPEVASTLASPIVVEGRLWGAVTVSSMDELLPFDVEERVEKFTELVATAIANAESSEARARLADEQSALRRVATLVVEGASPTAVLDAVSAEMAALLDADQVALNRFEPGPEIRVLAHRGLDVRRTPVGSRVGLDGESVTATVRRTGRPARMDHHDGASGTLAELATATGLRSSVGVPIVVDGRLWGIITASWKGEDSPPADTEARMARFAQLLDTAIANADSRDQLTASRARLLTAADDARRRVVRDLHDGAQQRFVHTIMTLKFARRALQENDGQAESLVSEALEHAEQGNQALRELAHGILPAVLDRGLGAAVDSIATRLDLPVAVDVSAERLPADIEASAYFIVAEALTNIVKHAQATRAAVTASVHDGMLRVEVRDDGVGGADANGHGLVGMADRVTALGGRLELESPSGGGTLLAATLPLSAVHR
jgi:GAF domain-containing protein